MQNEAKESMVKAQQGCLGIHCGVARLGLYQYNRGKIEKLKYIEAIEKYGEDFFIGGAPSIKYISA